MGITFFSVNGAGQQSGVSTVHTSNGISGDGSVGSPVILGGLLSGATVINPNGQFLQIADEVVGTAGGFQVTIGDSTSATGQGALEVNEASASMVYTKNSTSFKRLTTDPTTGIKVIDNIDNLGLLGDADYTAEVLASPGGLAYPQLITIQSLLGTNNIKTLATWDLLAQSTTQNVLTYAVPAGHSVLYRMNYSLGYISGAANAQISIQYTDIHGNAISQNIALGLIGLGNIAANGYPTVFKPSPGTNVIVAVTLSGVISYDTSGSLEQLFSI